MTVVELGLGSCRELIGIGCEEKRPSRGSADDQHSAVGKKGWRCGPAEW